MNAKTRVRCFTIGDACYFVLHDGAVLRVYVDEAKFGYLTWADIAKWAERVPWVGF